MNKPVSERDRVALLLPWFVNDTLSVAEYNKVRRHLDGCDECTDAVAYLDKLQNNVRTASPTPIVPAQRIDDLLARIDAPGATDRGRQRSYQWAIAATVILATTALVFFGSAYGVRDNQAPQFETATTQSSSSDIDYVFDLQFEAGTAASDRDRILRSIGVTYTTPPSVTEKYRVTVKLPTRTLRELDEFTQLIQDLPEITSADVVALQLPVGTPE